MEHAPILGAGGYGIVFSWNGNAIKVFYDLNRPNAIEKEAAMQSEAREILRGAVEVPTILSWQTKPIWMQGTQYLCGIEMEQVPILEEFGEPLHILLGYHEDDINTSWGRSSAKPVGPQNPSRGFFAGGNLLDSILQEDGLAREEIAYTMGISLRALLEGGILPNDLEWIYGGEGRLYLIDFGLCEFGKMTPEEFLNRKGSFGIQSDIYIPHRGDRGYEEFIRGFLG